MREVASRHLGTIEISKLRRGGSQNGASVPVPLLRVLLESTA